MLFGVLVAAAIARGDMMPLTKWSVDVQSARTAQSRCDRQQGGALHYDMEVTRDLPLSPFDVPLYAAPAQEAPQPVHAAANALELSGGPGSCSLCMYALVGLGLCSAPHWVRRISFGFIPEWYHDGGPGQIGHSYAAPPESLCSLQLSYLPPPGPPADHFLPQHRSRAVALPRRKSQYTPSPCPSRGPPA